MGRTLCFLATAGLALGSVLPSAQPAPQVPYLASLPAIDGVLDEPLARLAARELTPVSAAARPSSFHPPTVRVAYGADFLYVFAEFQADRIVTRDRAYQNGDGLLVVLTHPRADGEPSEQFYVLGFSAGQPAARWQERFVWYRNTVLEMRPLEDTRVATASRDGRVSFEVLVPWREAYPFHPWLSDSMGFNACVTQAATGDSSIRSCLVPDSRVDSEQSPRRSAVIAFEAPRAGPGPQAAAVLDRNHVARGEAVKLRVTLLADQAATFPLTIRVLSGEGARLAGRRVEITAGAGLGVREVEVPATSLAPGGYMIAWELADRRGQLGLSVLGGADATAVAARLERVRRQLSPGSYATLQFQLEEIERQRRALLATDVAVDLRLAIDEMLASLGAAEAGTDIIATRTGIQRRAYRSRVDGSLQPYSVRVPPGYDATRASPLFVYLHGSGEDDRGQLSRSWFPQDCLLAAPRGGGPSTWYTIDHSQDDIRQVVDDVMANYAVDPARVVLAGFSMGGYGVYRTYRESPSRYRALAVFSGPARPRSGAAAGAPDFLAGEDLSIFRRVPLFVFHGGRDRNCPIEDARALVERLRQAGADVTFIVEEDKGHETPNDETLGAFGAWLTRVIGGAPRD